MYIFNTFWNQFSIKHLNWIFYTCIYVHTSSDSFTCGCRYVCFFCSFSFHSSKDKSPRLAVKTWSHLQQQSLSTPKNNAHPVCVWVCASTSVCIYAPVCIPHQKGCNNLFPRMPQSPPDIYNYAPVIVHIFGICSYNVYLNWQYSSLYTHS